MSIVQKEFISFEEAIRKIIKDGDKINISNLYLKDKKQSILYPEETGYNEKQFISREDDLEFFFSHDESGVPTFWGRTTFAQIFLKGEEGATNGLSVIQKACELWSNLKIGLKAKPVQNKDIDYLRNKEKTRIRLEENKKMAWLGTSYVYSSNIGYMDFGLYLVSGSGVYSYGFFDTSGNVSNCNFGVLPAISVFLPSRILVDIKRSKDTGIWQLIPNKC